MNNTIKKKRTAWNKGIPMTEEAKVKRKETCRKKYGKENVSQVEEIKEKIQKTREDNNWLEKVRATKEQRYGDPNYTNVQKIKQTKLERYGDENYNNIEKSYQTNIVKYGYKHHNQNLEIRKKISDKKLTVETQQKYENTLKEKYGTNNLNLIPDFQQKRQKTLYHNYGVLNPLQSPTIKQKQLNTLRKNGTFNKSKEEDDYYQFLLESYSEDDILRQYSDNRYPFRCDFYIKSEDKFIELNLHWTHGKMPYDEADQECQEKLKIWQEKAKTSKFYQNAIQTWTVRDVAKYTVARNNNLNIEFIYTK